MENRPNVVVIMTDQQRADLRYSEGFALDTMPFLDSMAKNGADFTRAYTSNPTCVPARVSLFTGRYPSATHVKTNHNIDDAFYTKDILDIFKEQGYRTALCGKNHSHRKPDEFDYTYELSHTAGYRLDNNASEAEKAFDQHIAGLHHATEKIPSPFQLECQGPYRAVTKAIEWIDKADNAPFFLWLSFAEPHNPYQVSEPYFSMFQDNLPPLKSDKSALADKSFKYRWLRGMWEKAFPDYEETIDRARANYYGMLRLIDDQLKRFINSLEDKGRKDNTIIVYLSDHGDFVGEYGLIRKGPELPEVLCRIPMVFSGPHIRKTGKINHVFTSITDILPTLCDAIGAKIPSGVQGNSLWKLLTDEKANQLLPASAYMEHGFGGAYYDENDELDPKEEGALNQYSTFDCLNSWTQSGTMRAVRKDKYKLIYDMEGNGQLYDIEQDPVELKNLFHDPEYYSVRAELMEELAKRAIQIQDPLPLPRKRYVFKENRR